MSDKFAEKINDIHKVITSNSSTVNLDWEQIDLAIRIVDPEANFSFIYEEVIPPGVSGWVEAPSPEGRVGATRYFTEWGDGCVRTKQAYNTRERLYIELHHTPPVPTTFKKAKYWNELGSKWFFWRENTDEKFPAEYHMIATTLLPKAGDWARWQKKIEKKARELLEEE